MVGLPFALYGITAHVTSSACLGKNLFSFAAGKRLSEHPVAQFELALAPRSERRCSTKAKADSKVSVALIVSYGTPIWVADKMLASLCLSFSVASVTRPRPCYERRASVSGSFWANIFMENLPQAPLVSTSILRGIPSSELSILSSRVPIQPLLDLHRTPLLQCLQ
jgi:hypothetical protein